MTKKAGAGAGSISQRQGSVDPDLYQIVTDPQHWLQCILGFENARDTINVGGSISKVDAKDCCRGKIGKKISQR
jgi:hypothetical protein